MSSDPLDPPYFDCPWASVLIWPPIFLCFFTSVPKHPLHFVCVFTSRCVVVVVVVLVFSRIHSSCCKPCVLPYKKLLVGSVSHFTVCRRCREVLGADVLFSNFLYFLENLRLVEARCANMLRALEQETTLTHFRGVAVATLGRQSCQIRKNHGSTVNYQWIRDSSRTGRHHTCIRSKFSKMTELACERGDIDTPKVCEGCLLFRRPWEQQRPRLDETQFSRNFIKRSKKHVGTVQFATATTHCKIRHEIDQRLLVR